MTNFVQEANYFQGDLTDMTEEDYWYSVEQDKYKSEQLEEELEEQLDEEEEEEYWYSVEKDRYKEQLGDLEYCEDIYENLREEYGNNMSNDFHELVIATTLSIIEDYEKLYKTELNEESYDKMICEIYPEICALFNN